MYKNLTLVEKIIHFTWLIIIAVLLCWHVYSLLPFFIFVAFYVSFILFALPAIEQAFLGSR